MTELKYYLRGENSQNENSCLILLGQLKINLISLETLLRFYLFKKESCDKDFVSPTKIKIGDKVKINAFTNYDTLDILIEKYNKYQKLNDKINSNKILSIRNLLAHGRAYSLDCKTNFPLVFVKFSKEHNGFVKMIYKESLDSNWLKKSINHIYILLEKIGKQLS